MHASRLAARQAKAAYELAINQRSNSQREVNDLLQRKSHWTDSDVNRFTALVREDHLREQAETRAKAAVSETEDAVDREFSEMMRSILARYHEEQVWSDKIRSASTYGSLVVLGLNLFVFIVAIAVVEPWKRRKLAQTLETKMLDMSAQSLTMVGEGLKEIRRQLEDQRILLDEGVQMMSKKPQQIEETQRGEGVELIRRPEPEDVTKRTLGSIVVVSAIISAGIGWLARSWFGM
jgi:sensitive to high expression protein 9